MTTNDYSVDSVLCTATGNTTICPYLTSIQTDSMLTHRVAVTATLLGSIGHGNCELLILVGWKISGSTLPCHCSMQIFEKRPTTIKNFGIWVRYQSRTGYHNMYKEYRDTTLNGAVSQLYQEMNGRHRVRYPCIQIIKTATVPAKFCKRANTQQVGTHCHLAGCASQLSTHQKGRKLLVLCDWNFCFKHVIAFPVGMATVASNAAVARCCCRFLKGNQAVRKSGK